MSNYLSAFQGKKVLVTGDTGFKGSWLTKWLLELGANVTGIALEPDHDNALFQLLDLEQKITHHNVDIRDGAAVQKIFSDCMPDYVFHLAAQSLVRESYEAPLYTYETNVLGTVHILSALKNLEHQYEEVNKVCSTIIVTTDKCYENKEWKYGYREIDPLGGYDPYSASKACAEIATNSYRQSFFNDKRKSKRLRIGVASARAGNVIGGGDWAKDRIVPDIAKALSTGQLIEVRNPKSTRPWQHVLEPLSGYLLLATRIMDALEQDNQELQDTFCSAYNFGPLSSANRPVMDLVKACLSHWQGQWVDVSNDIVPHEASLLNLVWDKAYHELDWHPVWSFNESIEKTINWYKKYDRSLDTASSLVDADIKDFTVKQTNS